MRVQIDQARQDCFSRCIDYMRVFWPVCRVGRKNLGNLVSFNHQRALARWCARAVKDSSVAENQGAPAREGTLVIERNRSEEHTSELQSRLHLVCRLLLEKKKK